MTSTTMYSVKPIINHEVMDVQNSMYQCKPIINSNSTPAVSSSRNPIVGPNEQNAKMESLETRQQNILLQLQQLKEQLLSMGNALQEVNKAEPKAKKQTSGKATTAKPIDLSQLTDIVVNTSPDAVPYSLLAVKNLWKNRLNIDIQCYTHSSVENLTEEAKNFENLVQSIPGNAKLPKLKVILIWKIVPFGTELIATDLPILGEVNILRHLSRIGPNEFDYEAKDNCNEIDVVFDLCYMLRTAGSAKERQTIIKHLNNRLGKAQFYGESSEITLGDVAFGSVVKQLEAVIGKDLLPTLKALLQRVTAVAKF